MFSEIWAADSGDIVTAIYTKGFIHPPGFPIYNILGQLFRYFSLGTPAQKIALISFLLWTLTVILMFFITKALLLSTKDKKRHLKHFALVSAVVLVFFNPVGLIYALTPEVFTLTTLLLSINTYYLYCYINKKREQDHHLFWLTFFIGFFHHYLILLSLLVYLFFQRTNLKLAFAFLKVNNFKIVVYFLIGLLPYIINYLYWDVSSPVFWQEKSFSNLFSIITRADYGFFATAQNSYQPFLSKFQNIWFYLLRLLDNFSLLGFVLGLIGIYYSRKQHHKYYDIFLALFLLYGPLLIFYFDANFANNLSKAALERYFLLSYIFLIPFLYLGFIYLLEFIKKLVFLIIRHKALQDFTYNVFVIALVILFPLLMVLKNINFVISLSKNTVFKDHALNILNSAPKDAIILVSKDLNLFPVQYYRYVLNYRKDLLVLSHLSVTSPTYLKQINLKGYNLKIPSQSVRNHTEAFIKSNLKNYRVFSNTFIIGKSLKLNGSGLLDEVSLRSRPKPENVSFEVKSNFLLTQNYVYPVYFFEELKRFYRRYYYFQSLKYEKKNDLINATNNARLAYEIDATDKNTVTLYSLLLIKNKQCKLAKKVLVKYFSYSMDKEVATILANLYAVCYQDKLNYLYWQKIADKLKLAK